MNYCPEIHHGLFLYPNGHDEVHYAPCCQADFVTIDNNNFDFQNSEFLNQIRKENLQGVRSKTCNRCWQAEDNGNTSKRQSSLEFAIDKKGLEILEYNVNWACNLACIMCGPQCSSTWAKELGIKNNLDKIDRRKNIILESLDLSNLKRIHFNGGEPLINEDHVTALEKIDNIAKTKITYNTNGTKLPSKRAMKYWEKSEVVRLFFSIDATESSFEYIRYPGKWNTIVKNMEWFLQNSPSNVLFGLNVTFGAYNILEAVSLYNWFEKNLATNREGDASEFCWQIAYNFDYKHLPEQIKQDALISLKDCENLKSLYNSIEVTMNDIPNNNWMIKLDELDSRRKTSWRKALNIGKYFT